MSRNTWRNIFVGIILLSIPCYLLGIGVWFFRGGGTQPTPTATVEASRTPIDPNALLTELALTNPALIATDVVLSPTPLGGGDNTTPIVPTANVGFTPVIFFTPTNFPTRFVTSTPTLPPPATNTPVNTNPPPNTPIPTNTPQVLLPPTDTPSP